MHRVIHLIIAVAILCYSATSSAGNAYGHDRGGNPHQSAGKAYGHDRSGDPHQSAGKAYGHDRTGDPHRGIGLTLHDFPDLRVVPGYPVYYAPRLEANYFFYDGMYWVYRDDNWYSSTWYDGPWRATSHEEVPVYVLRIPVRYYREPPEYFRGWKADAPPHWGDHWGRAWEHSRTGWDKWNHSAAPALAPLPTYQKKYSGDRYPRQVERQRELQQHDYRYAPRDPVVRKFYQQLFHEPEVRREHGNSSSPLRNIARYLNDLSGDTGRAHDSIGLRLNDFPDLRVVPGYPVYYAPRLDANYFFYDGMYWVYRDDNWYSSAWYDGPWWGTSREEVPLYVLRIPVRYYRQPPEYFRGWKADAPPHWGDHWGRAWEHSRTGWDQWNHSAAPAPAPLPTYQKKYSGDRYPRQVDRQRELQEHDYRYDPRDPVVRKHYQQLYHESATQGAPAREGTSKHGRQGVHEDRGSQRQDIQRSTPASPQHEPRKAKEHEQQKHELQQQKHEQQQQKHERQQQHEQQQQKHGQQQQKHGQQQQKHGQQQQKHGQQQQKHGQQQQKHGQQQQKHGQQQQKHGQQQQKHGQQQQKHGQQQQQKPTSQRKNADDRDPERRGQGKGHEHGPDNSQH